MVDANRAFSDGIDRGVLTRWVPSAVCGSADAVDVEGPDAQRCIAFDSACARGRHDVDAECCTAEHLTRGTVCGDGGRCDGAGGCLPADEVLDGVAAPFDWLAVFPDGYPDDALIARRLADVVQVGVAPVGLPEDSLEIREPIDEMLLARLPPGVSEGLSDEPAVEPDGPPEPRAPVDLRVLAIVPPEVARAGRVTVLASAADAPLRLVAFDGPPGMRALVLGSDVGPEIDEVYAVTGRLDELATVLSDGSSEGTLRVPCGQDVDPVGDVRCDRVGGRAVLVGPDLALAWVPPPSDLPVTDVLVGGVGTERGSSALQPGRDFSIIAAAPPCAPQTCTLPSGCTGRRLCTDGTTLGPCVALSDTVCDGIDQDCDGAVDESAAPSCNDGISCTVDYCGASGACVNLPSGALCDDDVTLCTVGICTNAAGATNASRTFTTSDALVTPTGVTRPTGCTFREGHSWCTNVFDSCTCNGPERCVATARVGQPAPAGCISAPIAVDGVVQAPCDADGMACTAEQACCEPAGGMFCRVDAIQASLTPILWANRNAACDLGTETEMWPSLAADGFPTAPSPAAVRCSPVERRGLPYTARCQNDGNPCTTMSCNAATGACTAGIVPGTAPAESFVNPATGVASMGAACNLSAPDTSECSSLRCDGTTVCHPVARLDGTRTSGCGVLVPPGTSSGDDPNTCGTPACEAGRCNPAYVRPAPATTCIPFPSGCGTTVCSADTAMSTEWPDVRTGCRPTTGCYLAVPGINGSNGVLNGQCFPAGPLAANPCSICEPSSNPFATRPAPAGTACTTDNNPCTADLCSAVGTCLHNCLDTPECEACVS